MTPQLWTRSNTCGTLYTLHFPTPCKTSIAGEQTHKRFRSRLVGGEHLISPSKLFSKTVVCRISAINFDFDHFYPHGTATLAVLNRTWIQATRRGRVFGSVNSWLTSEGSTNIKLERSAMGQRDSHPNWLTASPRDLLSFYISVTYKETKIARC